MGAIRGILLVFVCSILFLSLFVGNILFTLSSSLEYENVKPELVSFLGNVISEQMNIEEKLNQLLPAIQLYCQINTQYSFNYGEYIITIPCDIATQNSTTLVQYGINSFVDQYYYTEYNCTFMDCFKEKDIPLFLISEKAQIYWQGKFYFVLLFSIILTALVFLLVEKKINFFLLTGSLMIVSSLPLMKLDKIAPLFSKFSGDMGEYFSRIILIFFNQAHDVLIKSLIIGGVLVIVGLVLKLFHIGFVISNFLEKLKPHKKAEKVKLNKPIKQLKKEKQIKSEKLVKQVKPEKQFKSNKVIKQVEPKKQVKQVILNKKERKPRKPNT